VAVLVAALIAAAAALLVTVVERRFVARDERRRWEVADKRRVYAEFLTACTEYTGGYLLQDVQDVDPWIPFRRTEVLGLRWVELQLVATADVAAAGKELFRAVLQVDTSQETTAEVRDRERDFVEVARRDLGY
jgi:hypothetical protein